MLYRGRYDCFDFSRLRTYPIADRPNILKLEGLVHPGSVRGAAAAWPHEGLHEVATAVLAAREHGLPVILFSGAHIIKLGFSPLVIDLMRRGLITLFATNGAGSIHDFELALIGETSESVPNALPQGLFGMAEETGAYMNAALQAGERDQLGYGESIGKFVASAEPAGVYCPHWDISILGRAYELGIPATVHATIGTDIIDQHPTFDGAAKGGCSGRDLGIFAGEVARLARRTGVSPVGGGTGGPPVMLSEAKHPALTNETLRCAQGDNVEQTAPPPAGVVLNIGSAVTGPEVLLKSVSMAANVGAPPTGLITANFDLRGAAPEEIKHTTQPKYYYRDMKSIVTRIPQAFGGQGHMIEGDFLQSIPALYELLTAGTGQ